VVKRKAFSALILTLLLTSMFVSAFNIQPAKAGGTIYIRADGSIDPPTAPISTVDNITYTFTDSINDSIVVERSNIIMDGAGYTLQGPGNCDGFCWSGINNVTIKNTNIKDFATGIGLVSSSNNSISGNNITNNGDGIRLFHFSNYNSISGNNITNNNYGIFFLFISSNNTVVGNSIASNGLGVYLVSSSNNLFYHNNFIDNSQQANTGGQANSWDHGYPSGGNYWSDYSSLDLYNGPSQNETGSDGIGDAPYVIDAVNVDHYPFMGLSGQQSVRQLAVPFFYQEKDYYCGPACLKMVFSYYGERISQAEIANVARTSLEYDGTAWDELRRAGHFSNQSTSMGNETPQNITGYTLRKLGYAAFECQGMTLAQLENCLDEGEPLILIMWYSYHHVSTHYRVATGYNQTHVFVHDPWNEPAWGGAYGGPDTAFNVTEFMDLWSYSNDYALYVAPWEINISAPAHVMLGTPFLINVTIVYPQPLPNAFSDYPAYPCDASITLPANLSLAEGEAQKKTIGTGSLYAGGNGTVSWTVVANSSVTGTISITAQGWVSGYVYPYHEYPAYFYNDRIGATVNSVVTIMINDANVSGAGGGGRMPYMD